VIIDIKFERFINMKSSYVKLVIEESVLMYLNKAKERLHHIDILLHK
jgi:hypothetical protein